MMIRNTQHCGTPTGNSHSPPTHSQEAKAKALIHRLRSARQRLLRWPISILGVVKTAFSWSSRICWTWRMLPAPASSAAQSAMPHRCSEREQGWRHAPAAAAAPTLTAQMRQPAGVRLRHSRATAVHRHGCQGPAYTSVGASHAPRSAAEVMNSITCSSCIGQRQHDSEHQEHPPQPAVSTLLNLLPHQCVGGCASGWLPWRTGTGSSPSAHQSAGGQTRGAQR